MDMKEQNQRTIEEFRANREQGGNKFAGRPLLLLTITGAKSDQPRTTPMMYVRVDDQLLVIASNAGAPRHPDWYHNLRAHPEVSVEVGNETFTFTATEVAGDARQPLWDSIVAQYPFFAEHQAKITRQIPVIMLTRHAG